MANRFHFHGFAIGAAGRITSPFSKPIEVQASVALPQIGGYGQSRSARFKFREFLQFELAHCEVSGDECVCDDDERTSFRTRLTSTVEGLNISGMVTADRVVATLSSIHVAGEKEPSVRLIGSRFENLRIAGIPVEVDIATDVFDRYPTHSELRDAYGADEKLRRLIDGPSVEEYGEKAPPHILRWFRPGKGAELPAIHGKTLTSLVRGIRPAAAGFKPWGHVIHLDGFGTIRLAEVEIDKITRTVNMIQVDTECPHKAKIMACSVSDGGDDYSAVD